MMRVKCEIGTVRCMPMIMFIFSEGGGNQPNARPEDPNVRVGDGYQQTLAARCGGTRMEAFVWTTGSTLQLA